MGLNKKGFTLIELIIVIIIIGILASIAAPMMMGNVANAKRSEAIAAMGAIRTAERIVYSQTSNYEGFSSGNLQNNMSQYMNSNDLNGTYYPASSYSVSGNVISAAAGTNGAPAVYMNLLTGVIGNSNNI